MIHSKHRKVSVVLAMLFVIIVPDSISNQVVNQQTQWRSSIILGSLQSPTMRPLPQIIIGLPLTLQIELRNSTSHMAGQHIKSMCQRYSYVCCILWRPRRWTLGLPQRIVGDYDCLGSDWRLHACVLLSVCGVKRLGLFVVLFYCVLFYFVFNDHPSCYVCWFGDSVLQCSGWCKRQF